MIFAYGGATTLEHPRGPSADQKLGWSIWESGFIKRWSLDGQVSLLTFLQGPLGRDFAKPTRLLVGYMPFLPGMIYSAYDLTWRPTRVLQGRNKEGEWNTSAGKAYPDKMCEVLAKSFVRHADSLTCEGEENDPEGLQEYLAALAWNIQERHPDDQQMGQDFQPSHFA